MPNGQVQVYSPPQEILAHQLAPDTHMKNSLPHLVNVDKISELILKRMSLLYQFIVTDCDRDLGNKSPTWYSLKHVLIFIDKII